MNCLCGHGEWCKHCSPHEVYPVRINSDKVKDLINFLTGFTPNNVGYFRAEKAYQLRNMLEYEL